MRTAGNEDFAAAVAGPEAVLVDFHASWCGPCKAMEPGLAALTGIEVVKVDVDEAGDVAAKYGIRSVPTLVVFRDGEPVAIKTGAMAPQALARWVADSAAA